MEKVVFSIAKISSKFFENSNCRINILLFYAGRLKLGQFAILDMFCPLLTAAGPAVRAAVKT